MRANFRHLIDMQKVNNNKFYANFMLSIKNDKLVKEIDVLVSNRSILLPSSFLLIAKDCACARKKLMLEHVLEELIMVICDEL